MVTNPLSFIVSSTKKKKNERKYFRRGIKWLCAIVLSGKRANKEQTENRYLDGCFRKQLSVYLFSLKQMLIPASPHVTEVFEAVRE